MRQSRVIGIFLLGEVIPGDSIPTPKVTPPPRSRRLRKEKTETRIRPGAQTNLATPLGSRESPGTQTPLAPSTARRTTQYLPTPHEPHVDSEATGPVPDPGPTPFYQQGPGGAVLGAAGSPAAVSPQRRPRPRPLHPPPPPAAAAPSGSTAEAHAEPR